MIEICPITFPQLAMATGRKSAEVAISSWQSLSLWMSIITDQD